MKRFKLIYLTLLFTALSGCSTNTGSNSFSTRESALGPTIGQNSDSLIANASLLTSRGLVGSLLDEQDRKVMDRTSPRTVERMERGEPLTVNDIIKLSQGGISDDTIINYMQQTASSYNLSQAQIRRLQDAGVSQRVINFMVDSGR
jgi:surface antigen